jgi:hypothetical protein
MKGDTPFTLTFNPKLFAKAKIEARKRGLTLTGLVRLALAREIAPKTIKTTEIAQ